MSDILWGVSAITKRQLVRNPALVSHLKPGESLEIQDGASKLIVSRPKAKRLSAEQIEADLQRLSTSDPKLDVQAVLNDLRG
jgi:hypothetical protein